MLVLSRYKDQSIYIGDDIVVTIVDVRGDRIRLGIEAPPTVAVHRQEIYEAIQKDKQSPTSRSVVSKISRETDDPKRENRVVDNEVFEFSLQ